MHLLTSRWHLVSLVGALLVSGFIAVNLANYYVSSQSVRSALINNELPLTSNNIYSEIQASLLRPIYISSLMANDTFLKDWMVDGEQDLEKIKKYLTEIRKKYDVSSTFVVSDETHRYYYYGGILKTISPNIPKDDWFFTMEAHDKEYRVDVDSNEANRNHLTIFVNHKLFDYDDNFIGVTGLGLDVVSVAEMIETYKEDFQRNIYFVDRSGQIKSHTDETMIDHINIHKLPGISAVADELLSGDKGFLMYGSEQGNMLLSYRFIPELDWYLLVEQPESEALRPIRQALYLNLGISAGVTLLVLLISGYTVNRFQSHLEVMAKTDKLTGLFNRQYFDALFNHNLNTVGRHTTTLSLAIFDIDNLKLVNDRRGHLAGDRLIQSISLVVRENLRKSDVVARWGGDEFAILFLECSAVQAVQIMEKIRARIVELLDDDSDFPASISVGVAQYEVGDTPDTLLARADENLYEAKRRGKNRVVGPESDDHGIEL